MVMSLLLTLALSADTPAADPIRDALAKESPPWYDPKSDGPRIVWPPEEPAAEAPRKSSQDDAESSRPRETTRSAAVPGPGLAIGPVVGVLMVVGIAAVMAGILYAYMRSSAPPLPKIAPRVPGSAARFVGLPPGIVPDMADPLDLARRLRAEGRRAEAIIALHVHQVFTLAGLGLIRPAPGKTGRQLIRAIAEAPVRDRATSTLRLFEAAYYGHRDPPEAEFERAWDDAEALERHLARGTRE